MPYNFAMDGSRVGEFDCNDRASVIIANSPIATAVDMDDSICSLCRRKVSGTKRMNCSHSVCKNCLTSELCPVCMQQCSSTVPRAEERFSIDNAVRCSCTNRNPAALFCADCDDFICAVCKDAHFRVAAAKNHLLIEVSTGNFATLGVSTVCQIHQGAKLSVFCHRCQHMVCQSCRAESHRGHHCTDVMNQLDVQREICNVISANLPGKMQSFRNVIDRITSVTQRVEKAQLDTRDEIRNAIYQIQEVVAKRVQSLAAEIDRRCEIERNACASMNKTFHDLLVSTAAVKQLLSQVGQGSGAETSETLLSVLNLTFSILKRVNETAAKSNVRNLDRPILPFSMATDHLLPQLASMGTFGSHLPSISPNYQQFIPQAPMLRPVSASLPLSGNGTLVAGPAGIPYQRFQHQTPTGQQFRNVPVMMQSPYQPRQNFYYSQQSPIPLQQPQRQMLFGSPNGGVQPVYGQWPSCAFQSKTSPVPVCQLPTVVTRHGTGSRPLVNSGDTPTPPANTSAPVLTPNVDVSTERLPVLTPNVDAPTVGNQQPKKNQDPVKKILASIMSKVAPGKRRPRARREGGAVSKKLAPRRLLSRPSAISTRTVVPIQVFTGVPIFRAVMEQCANGPTAVVATSENTLEIVPVNDNMELSVICPPQGDTAGPITESPVEPRLVIDESDFGVEPAITVEDSSMESRDAKDDIVFEKLETSCNPREQTPSDSGFDSSALFSTPGNVIEGNERSFWSDLCSVCNIDDGRSVWHCSNESCGRTYHSNHHVPTLNEGDKLKEGNWFCTFCTVDLATLKRTSCRESIGSKMNGYEQKVCERILLELYSHPDAVVFFEPVDASLECHERISMPIDFSWIGLRLSQGQYSKVEEFLSDLDRVFDNCCTFYKDKDPSYHSIGLDVGAYCRQLVQTYFPDSVDSMEMRHV